jgi:phage terminase large subunit
MSELTAEQRRELVAGIRLWRHEPWTFAHQVLQQDDDDPWQDEFYHALVGLYPDGRPMPEEERRLRFALAACKGPGKSASLAGAMWWFKLCFPDSKVVATSITGDNLRANLWTELAVWQQHSRLLTAAYEWTEDFVYERGRRETSYMMALEWQRSANPEQMANSLAGLHANFIMAVADESGGIPRRVFGSLDAVLANHDPDEGRIAYFLQAGNTTTTDGPLYDACTKDHKFWWVKKITGDPLRADRAKRVSKEWAQAQIDMHPGGREHPWVKVNVLGEFPPGGANNLIALADCQNAEARTVRPELWMNDPKVMGVDVARFGDDETALCFRQGLMMFRFKCFRNQSLMAIAGQVAISIDRWKPHAVFIDDTGVGAGVVDRLVQLRYAVTAVANGSAALGFSHVEWKLKNRREECWWQLADWLKRGCMPKDSQLVADLVGPTYKFTADNRLELESKKDMKKRGLPSPNRGDAAALTFAEPVPHTGLRSVADRVEEDRVMQERQRGHHGGGRAPGRGNHYNPIARRSH